MNAVHQLFVTAINQVVSADTIIEEGIPGEDNPIPHEADATRRMPRRVKDGKVKVADVNVVASFEDTVGVGRGLKGRLKDIAWRLGQVLGGFSVYGYLSTGGFLDLCRRRRRGRGGGGSKR